MCIPFLLLIALANCAYLLYTCLAGENCFLGHTAENSHQLAAKVISKEALF
jgi:hypothetical protein